MNSSSKDIKTEKRGGNNSGRIAEQKRAGQCKKEILAYLYDCHCLQEGRSIELSV